MAEVFDLLSKYAYIPYLELWVNALIYSVMMFIYCATVDTQGMSGHGYWCSVWREVFLS